MLATNSASCARSPHRTRALVWDAELSSWRTALVFMLLEIIVQQRRRRQGSAVKRTQRWIPTLFFASRWNPMWSGFILPPAY